LITLEKEICFLEKDNRLRNNLTTRVAELESRMSKLELSYEKLNATLSTMDGKLDSIISIENVAHHTGNWFITNLPRLITGIIGGLVAGGIITQPFIGG
jgi:tetrahydromethanopterin S-methyltransferase subunit B